MELLNKNEIIEVDKVKYTCRLSRDKSSYFYQSCPIQTLEKYFNNIGIKTKSKETKGYRPQIPFLEKKDECVLIYFEDKRRLARSLPSKGEIYNVILNQEFNKTPFRFVNKIFKNIYIRTNFTVKGQFINFDIKNNSGIVIGKIAYSHITKNTLGNSRVLLFDNCIHNLIYYPFL